MASQIALVYKFELNKIRKNIFYLSLLAIKVSILSILFYRLLGDYQTTLQTITQHSIRTAGITREVIKPYLGWVLLINSLVIPIITMQAVSRETQNRSFVFWATSPITSGNYVLGKYLALLSIVLTSSLIECSMPALLNLATNLDWGLYTSGVLGVSLVLATICSIGLLISCLSKTPALAFGLSFFVIILLALIEWLNPMTAASNIVAQFSIIHHAYSLLNGIIYLPDVCYYLAVVGFCIITAKIIINTRFCQA